jgi:enoyl-CoA hydratase/carnithine racemase
MAESPALAVTRDGRIERWRLARPARRNAIGVELVAQLLAAAAEVGDDCRIVVLSGEGPGFCAGSDLTEIAALDHAGVVRHEAHWAELSHALRTLDQIVVAGIHGHALGGGLALAALADLRVAERSAVLAMPEVTLGWLPPGGLEELIELIGAGRARELVLTGRRIDGDEGARLGLIDRVAADGALEDALGELCMQLLQAPGAGAVAVKRYWRQRAALTPGERQAAQLELFSDGVAHPGVLAAVGERFARPAPA